METKDVPYIIHETMSARLERSNRRLFICIIIAIVLLFLSNAFWLYAWMQYDYESEEITYAQDGRGFNNINTGLMGSVYGAEAETPEETLWADTHQRVDIPGMEMSHRNYMN